MDSDHAFNVTIAAGNPAVRLASRPDCACDGCDIGSADLLEDMDMWVLSVVDGSLEVDVTADHSAVRTSFKAGGAWSRISMNLRRLRQHRGPRTGRHGH